MPCSVSQSSNVSYLLGALTAIVAAVVTHLFAMWRESKNRKEAAKIARLGRKRDFLSKLGEWRTKVLRCDQAQFLINDFPAEVARFGGNYIAIEQDLSGKERDGFHALCDQIVAMTDGEIGQKDDRNELSGKAKLLRLIEGIIAILNRN